MSIRKLITIPILLSLSALTLAAQEQTNHSLIPGQPTYWSPVLVDGTSLVVTHDARSAGMGEVGVSTSPDAYSMTHNMSKLAFTDRKWGLSAAYVPWMADMVKDMNISSLVGFYSFEGRSAMRHAFSASLRYFHIGATQAIPKSGAPITTIHPYEFAVDLGYALRFHPHWSAGMALRYLISDYNYSIGGVSSKAAALLFDLSLSYVRPLTIAGAESVLRSGLALNHVGGKMSHDGGATYLFSPAVFRLGVGVTTEVSALSRVGVHLEMDKLLAPTYPSPDLEDYERRLANYNATNPYGAIFSSWADAPGGAAEELKELCLSLGAEYTYADRLTGRLGYRYQHPSKGMGRGFTLGLGLRYEMVQLDASYFISTIARSPLNNTLRLTVGIDF